MPLTATQQAAAALEAAILEFQNAVNNDMSVLDIDERRLLLARIATSERVLGHIKSQITRKTS